MNCTFCHQPCITNQLAPQSAVAREECHNHPHTVIYLYYKDDPDGLLDCYMMVPFRDETFMITFTTKINMGDGGMGDYFEIACGNHSVVNLHFIPDVTPENILDRLPTMITFS